MGTFTPGAMGPVNGKIGTLIASKWKKTFVAKGLSAKSKKPASLPQADHRAKFGVVTKMLGRVSELIIVGYQNATNGNNTAMNVASKWHLANAVIGTYPDYEIDLPKLTLSVGKPTQVENAYYSTLTAAAERLITVSWKVNPYKPAKTLETDKLTVLLYDEEKDRFITFNGIASRSALKAEMDLPEVYEGDTLHVWIFFVSADGKLVSETNYLGVIEVLA
jgi:hypothetical protein